MCVCVLRLFTDLSSWTEIRRVDVESKFHLDFIGELISFKKLNANSQSQGGLDVEFD